MSFFDSIPEPPPPEPVQTEQPASMRSDAVIPGSVPVTLWAAGPQPDPAHGWASRTFVALADDPDAGPA